MQERRVLISTIIALIVNILFKNGNAGERVILKTIANYPGMYFVPQFWFSLSNENWEVLYNIPLEPIDIRLHLIEEVWNQLQISKNSFTTVFDNNPKFELLQHTLSELKGTYTQLTALIGHKQRFKRGIFDSVGRIIKVITGNMDADDEHYYNKKINSINLDNRRIYQLEKDQLTIVQSALWGVNKTTSEMKENQDILTKSYLYLEKIMLSNREEIKDITIRYNKQLEILEEISVLQDLIKETTDVVHTLYDVIDHARMGKISSYLIKPKEFLRILQEVRSHLQIGDSLPIPVSLENVYFYYNIVKINVYYVDNYLRYIIKIPLKHISRRFHLFKIIQIPEINSKDNIGDKLFTFPEKTTDYIGLSEDLQYFVTPTQGEIQNCLPPPIIMCSDISIIFPMSQVEHTHVRCEIEIFKNKSEPKCNTRITNSLNPIWERIPNSNTWVFAAVPDNEVITVTCKNNDGIMTYVKDLKLPTKGQLTLDPDCMAVGSSFTLLSRETNKNELFGNINLIVPNIHFTPNKEEKKILEEYENFTKMHKELNLKPITHQLNDLNAASIRLTKLKEMMKDYEPIKFENNQSNSVYNYYILILVTIIIVVVVYVFTKCGILKYFKMKLTRRNREAEPLALEDIPPRDNNSDDEDTLESASNQAIPLRKLRRSERIMKVRSK